MKPKNAHYCNQIFLPKLWSVTTNILANKQNENDFLAENFKLALYNCPSGKKYSAQLQSWHQNYQVTVETLKIILRANIFNYICNVSVSIPQMGFSGYVHVPMDNNECIQNIFLHD